MGRPGAAVAVGHEQRGREEPCCARRCAAPASRRRISRRRFGRQPQLPRRPARIAGGGGFRVGLRGGGCALAGRRPSQHARRSAALSRRRLRIWGARSASGEPEHSGRRPPPARRRPGHGQVRGREPVRSRRPAGKARQRPRREAVGLGRNRRREPVAARRHARQPRRRHIRLAGRRRPAAAKLPRSGTGTRNRGPGRRRGRPADPRARRGAGELGRRQPVAARRHARPAGSKKRPRSCSQRSPPTRAPRPARCASSSRSA